MSNPKVLIMVHNGVVAYESQGDVDVQLIDFDCIEQGDLQELSDEFRAAFPADAAAIDKAIQDAGAWDLDGTSGQDRGSRTENCEDCGAPTSFERRDPKTQPPEGEVCEQCQRWVCPDCVHSIGEPCPPEQTNPRAQTATPWKAWHNQFGDLSGWTISGTKSEGIAMIVGHVGQNCEADAAYIVHCVNSHSQLVAALRGLLDAYARNAQRSVDEANGDENVLHSSVKNARAALANEPEGEL